MLQLGDVLGMAIPFLDAQLGHLSKGLRKALLESPPEYLWREPHEPSK